MTAAGLERTVHPAGEGAAGLVVDTPGGHFQVGYDKQLPISPEGPLVFFAQFFGASRHFECALRQGAADLHQSERAGQTRGVGDDDAGDPRQLPVLRTPRGVA